MLFVKPLFQLTPQCIGDVELMGGAKAGESQTAKTTDPTERRGYETRPWSPID